MNCPNCDYTELRPLRVDGSIRRYRCYECNYVFETVEQVREVAQRQAFQASMFEVLKEQPTHQNKISGRARVVGENKQVSVARGIPVLLATDNVGARADGMGQGCPQLGDDR